MTGVLLRILFIWVSCIAWTIAPVFGWNRYVPEGNMTACGTDYLSKDWLSRSYIVVYAGWVYFMPLFTIIFAYYFILKVSAFISNQFYRFLMGNFYNKKAVVAHERNMREQAKKMNVASLRSREAKEQSTEAKLAKVALMTITLWFMAWTPYLIINFAGVFEFVAISPLSTIWGSGNQSDFKKTTITTSNIFLFT